MKFLRKISVLFATLILFTDYTMATAPIVEQIKQPVLLTIPQKIVVYADKYDVSAAVISNIISCESQFNPNAVGDNGHSRGLVQIYDDYHPEVTHEQAFNEDFAIEFLAKKLAKDQGYLWSCYNRYY